MEALVRPPEAADAEPRLLLQWPGEQRRATSWLGSLLLHTLFIAVLLLIPKDIVQRRASEAHSVTPLIAPPLSLTQKAPNRGPIGHEFALDNLRPRPRLFVPPGPPASTRTAARKPAPAVPEPPKLEPPAQIAAQLPPPGSSVIAPPLPPPQIQTEEKPKIAFETPGAPAPPKPRGLAPPRVAAPGNSIGEAARSAIRSGGAGTAVGDLDIQGPGGIGPGLNLPASPGTTKSALEMLSDPMGVDFKPYLIRILAAVKRNWLAVIPETARLGRQGRVQIQFAIARDGSVPKLVIAMPSGTDSLDRAAVAGVSASTPFPPLPAEFRGEQVRLQFTFLYNTK